MSDINSEIKKLNADIISAHNNHYAISPRGLVNPDESANGNLIYHLYSNGEISFQKGGSAYLQRSEFTKYGKIDNFKALNLKFPKEAEYGSSYVILTEEECKNFRDQMGELIKKLI